MVLQNNKNQTSLEKWLILGLGQWKHKMGLEHYVVPGNKAALKNQKDRGRSKGHKNPTEGAPDGLSWNNLSNKIN